MDVVLFLGEVGEKMKFYLKKNKTSKINKTEYNDFLS